MQRVILDVDTGIDDALAISYAVRCSELDVIGITTCFGNVPVEHAARNTNYVLEKLGADIPVAKGVDQPLFRPMIKKYSTHFHGDNGLANLDIPAMTSRILPLSAARFIVEQVKAHPHDIVLICIGSLTNLALAIMQEPDIARLFKRIIIMGGAISVPGNNQMHAEANIYADPEAADYVFCSGAPITLVGLDVTMKTALNLQEVEGWRAKNTDLGQFLADITTYYIGSYRKFYGDRDHCALHDPLAVAAAINPDLVTRQPMYVRVDLEGIYSYGRTIADLRNRNANQPNVDVCVDVDVDRFKTHFMNTIC